MRRSDALAWLLACALGGIGLASAQQAMPESLRQQVATLPVSERDVMYRRAAMLRAMTPAQRGAFERRVAQWHALPVAERRERRERWQAWQALPVAERARVLQSQAEFAVLPVQEQLDLRARHAQLDAIERRGWLLGPALGSEWPLLQPLLQHVPPAQRDPLLAALRAMTPQQRVDLGVLAQRTPPQGRDALRRALLAQPEPQRGAWLVLQLER